MLTAHHIHKSYNLNIILEDISFSIGSGQIVGLIGPNGCGKTTLLRILAGVESPDRGHVSLAPGDLRLGYLAQGLEIDSSLSIGETIRAATGDRSALEYEVARLASALAQHPEVEELQRAYDIALDQLQDLSWVSYGETHAVLDNFGLKSIDMNQPVNKLSGGQKTRLSLALVMLSQPDLLLLDEPTNHLDIDMLEWLEGWLGEYPGAALIVSHDRTFLDRTVTRILDLDPDSHNIREYTGNYSSYIEQFLAERERQMAVYKDQEYEIKRLQQDIHKTKEQAAWVEKTTSSRQPGVRRIAKKVARKAKSREKKLNRYLKSDERVHKPKESWQMKLEFGDTKDGNGSQRHLGVDAFSLVDLSVGYEKDEILLADLNVQVQSNQRIALSGPNGCGKTTLLRTIAGKIPPLEGAVQLGSSAKLGYMSQEQELLDPKLNALETIRSIAPLDETEARSFLHYFLFSADDPLRPIQQLSFGERSRLRLAALVVEGCNLLLLDEPINHLDIPSRSRFEEALTFFEGTVLAVVHDRYFIERFAGELWLVEGKGITRKTLRVK